MKMLEIGDRVYSKNYGYGVVDSLFIVDGNYVTATIILEGLTIDGVEYFRKGHMTHCTPYGLKSIWEKPDPEVDFTLVEETE